MAAELVSFMNPGQIAGNQTTYVPWECSTRSGKEVSSGVYFGEVVWGGQRSFFKMAIIRGSGL